MRSRASEPFLNTVMPMNAPVGEAKTCPVPSSLGFGVGMIPKMVSLVPSETATMPSLTSPVPTRLQGLSPDHTTTRAGGRLYRFVQ